MLKPEFPTRGSSRSPGPGANHENFHGSINNREHGNFAQNARNLNDASQPPAALARSWDRPSEFNPSSSSIMDTQKAAAMEKTRHELSKLLSVALQRLRERERPPSVFQAASALYPVPDASRPVMNMHTTVNAVRGAVRLASNSGSEWHRAQDSRAGDAGTYNDEDDDEGHTTGGQGTVPVLYSTEQTFRHLTVVRDTLIIEGSTIFAPSPTPALSRQKGSWVGRSISPSRRRSAAGGDADDATSISSKLIAFVATTNDSLLDDLMSILAEIIKEDCRYKVSRFRPLCPPNALQGVVLEVASILARLQRYNPANLTRLGFAMLPAFSTFAPSLHERIMKFFEELLKGMLVTFSKERLAGFKDFATGNIRGLDRQNLDGSVPEIQVEWAAEDSNENVKEETQLFRPWIESNTKAVGVSAWTAPRQPVDNYYPGSLISPLLACMFRIVGIHSQDHTTLYRFHETLSTITRLKEDAYADIVDVVAFESSKSRRAAVEALTTFWPRAFGHLILSGPLEVASYQDFLRRIEESTGQSHRLRYGGVSQPPPRTMHPAKDIHEFILWRFQATSLVGNSRGQNNRPPNRLSANCAVCTKPITGLGLFCPCCTLAVHTGTCYDHEAGVDRLKYTSRDGRENISIIRYSRRLPQRRSEGQAEYRKDRHHFEAVHLFSLALCFVCRKPSWGCYDQGFRCSTCLHFAHVACIENTASSRDVPSCRSTPFSYKSVTIQWDVLRRSWVDFYAPLIWKEEELLQKSFDEVSVAYGIFWMELELLQAGTASSSIIVEQSTPRSQASVRPNGSTYDTFELHYFVALYLAQLSGSRLQKSRNALEYVDNCGSIDPEISLIHNLPLLLLAASVIKMPRMSQSSDGDMLQVGAEEENTPEVLLHPFEIVSLGHIRDALGYEVSLHSDASAQFTMSQLHRLGVFMRVDASPELFRSLDSSPAEVVCTFPSTLAIDASTSVEALFTSIQACLEDLDLSVNEFGFLLLVRRCWPSGMMTDYALARLASLVLAWVLTEDDRLLQIVRDFVAVGESLPGVRPRNQRAPWPPLLASGENGSGSSGSGAADYTSTRRAIIERYANPWLHQLHDLNRTLYAECLYQQCLQLSEASCLSTPGLFSHTERAEEVRCRHDVEMADDTLKYVVKLCQWGIVWTTFDDLFINWLDTMSRLGQFSTPVIFKNLPRLFSADDYSMNRLSIGDETTNSDVSQYMADPWRVVVNSASEDTAGLERCLQWVLVLARSGVEIPNNTLMQLSAFARDFNAPFITHSILAEVLLYSVWVKSFGRGELLTLVSSLYARQSNWLKSGIVNKDHLELTHGFLRHTLAACLLLYGCKRETVRSLKLLDPSQLITLPPRRRSNVTADPSSTDPLSIDMDMLDLLSTAAIEGTTEACIIVAKFLSTLVSKETGYLLSDDDVDQFVMINGYTLCKCAWHFYSQTQIPELNALRIPFLLRLLIVDSKPFENLLEEILHKELAWESRFEAITRIFRIILDINTPGLEIVGRQWRPDVVFVFVRFFSQSWTDDRAEVRLACEILISTLLPTHMETMTRCFEEYLTRATIAERTALAMFLTLLHPMLPSWPLLSWTTLVQALGGNDERRSDDTFAMNQDLEIATLRATLINLALQMIADGVMADLVSLLQIKLCLVRLIGFQRCQMTSGNSTFRVTFSGLEQLSSSPAVQSCFQGLMRALDTSLPCDLPPACMVESNDDSVAQGLLGSVLVDVVIKTINQIDFLQTPYIVARCLLTSLVIILSKHDFTSPLLQSWIQPLFSAVHTVMQLLSQPSLSFDLKQMIFTAAGQAAKQIHIDRKTSTVMLSEYITVATTVVTEYGVSSDHTLAARGRQFFDEILMQFEAQKVYWTLFKYPRSQDFFIVLAQVMRERIRANPQTSLNAHGDGLRDAVVREILSSVHDKRQPVDVETPLKNLATYVEVVHHTGYPDSLIAYLGLTLTSMAAQIADWKPAAFDPNSLLRVCSLVAQHHKPQSKDLLLQAEKYLRVVLARFSVNQETITQLLQVSTSSHRRLSRVTGGQSMPNCIPLAIYDTATGMLRGRIRGQPSNLRHLLEIICQSMMMKDGIFDTEQAMSASADGVVYFQDRVQDGPYNDTEFAAHESVAKLMLQATNLDSRLLSNMAAQESDASLRMWNFLLLAVLSMDWSECALSLWKVHARFSQIVQRVLVPQQTLLTDPSSVELNQAFIAIRLWLLLIQQICNRSALSTVVGHVTDRDQCERVLWNEVWPPFERLLLFSIGVAGFDECQTQVALIWQSFVDVVLFLHHSRSLIPLESSLTMHLVQLKNVPFNESLSNKISRTLRTISQPPADVPFSSSLLVVRNDFVAVEKIGWEFRRRAEERGKDDSNIRRHQYRQPTAG